VKTQDQLLLEQAYNSICEGIPVYKNTFHSGGKDLYTRFRKIFKNLPEYVANDLWNQRGVGKNDEVQQAIKQNKDIDAAIKNVVLGLHVFKPNQIDPGTGITVSEFSDFYLNGTWKLQILNVTPNSFIPYIQEKFKKRNYGLEDLKQGSERIKFQQAQAKADGSNEPVVILNTSKGLVLSEGFHRTMSILSLGKNGDDTSKWNPVKIKAWVCSK